MGGSFPQRASGSGGWTRSPPARGLWGRVEGGPSTADAAIAPPIEPAAMIPEGDTRVAGDKVHFRLALHAVPEHAELVAVSTSLSRRVGAVRT